MVLKRLKAVLAFLSIIPVKRECFNIEEVAENMPLFPLIGLFLGFIFGFFHYTMTTFLTPALAAALTFMLIEVLTGFHHIDGLLDFGDGIMAYGPPEKKIAVMHDKQTGTGGYTLALTYALVLVACLASMRRQDAILVIAIAESFAKFSMVVAARIGRSAYPGINKYFVSAMKRRNAMLKGILALLPTLAIPIFLNKLILLVKILAASALATAIILAISNRHFNGVTGDVFGAINELSRMSALVAAVLP